MKNIIRFNSPNRNRVHCKLLGGVLAENADLGDRVRELEAALEMVSRELDYMFGSLGIKAAGGSLADVLASLEVAISCRMFGAEAAQRELEQKLERVKEAHPYLSIELQL